MICFHLSRATRLAVACLAVFSVNSPTNAKLSADHVPTGIVSSWQGLPSLDLAVCVNPLVMLESEKTNVLRALLGEEVEPLQLAGR